MSSKTTKPLAPTEAMPTTNDGDAPASVEPVLLRDLGGTGSSKFNVALFRHTSETARIVTSANPDVAEAHKRDAIGVTADALRAFAPTDGVEGMIAAQAVALHNASMECFRLAMLPGQPWDVTCKARKDGANLSRAMVDMVDALERKRGRGPQIVRVERVMVADGGQAIVGNVTANGTVKA